jgi:transcriptional regulator with XRE-family HTH domain
MPPQRVSHHLGQLHHPDAGLRLRTPQVRRATLVRLELLAHRQLGPVEVDIPHLKAEDLPSRRPQPAATYTAADRRAGISRARVWTCSGVGITRLSRSMPGNLMSTHGRKCISQETAAARAGITQAQLSRIENGAPISHLNRLIQWVETLRIPANHLWFSMPDRDVAQRERTNVNRNEFFKTAGLAVVSSAASRLLAGLPVSAVTDDDCAQWLAWELWNRKLTAIPAAELPAPIARHLLNRPPSAAGHMVLRNPDGSYSFAQASLVDFLTIGSQLWLA